MRLDQEREIIQMARELKVDFAGGPVAGIVQYCKKKLRAWMREAGHTALGVIDLEKLICKKLQLIFEEIHTDADLQQLIKRYVAAGEPVFATLKADLDSATFAALIECHHVPSATAPRYVAVIDCRGDKVHRRFFTKWHEIAHLLTLFRQLELPIHRSKEDSSPIERLMDTIAGEIGFPDEAMKAALGEELAQTGYFTFAAVERIREKVCPEASLQSTLNACVKRWPKPAVLIEVAMSLKKTEQAKLDSSQMTLIASTPPERKLRVVKMLQGDAARKVQFRIDPYMAVPYESIIRKKFDGSEPDLAAAEEMVREDLSIWRHSNGESVGSGPIRVETKRLSTGLWAIIQPDRLRRHSHEISIATLKGKF